jgi:outer membrane lipoprotein SlyB
MNQMKRLALVVGLLLLSCRTFASADAEASRDFTPEEWMERFGSMLGRSVSCRDQSLSVTSNKIGSFLEGAGGGILGSAGGAALGSTLGGPVGAAVGGATGAISGWLLGQLGGALKEWDGWVCYCIVQERKIQVQYFDDLGNPLGPRQLYTDRTPCCKRVSGYEFTMRRDKCFNPAATDDECVDRSLDGRASCP